MEGTVAVVAKEFKDAVNILKDLQKEFIISSFDEDEDDAEGFGREAIERGRKIVKDSDSFFAADAVYVNGAFEDDENIVNKLMSKIETMMQPEEAVWYFEYE